MKTSASREPEIAIDNESDADGLTRMEMRNAAISREIRRQNKSGSPKFGAASAFELRALVDEIEHRSTLLDQSRSERESRQRVLAAGDAGAVTLEQVLIERRAEADRLRHLLLECETSKLWRLTGLIARPRSRRRSIDKAIGEG